MVVRRRTMVGLFVDLRAAEMASWMAARSLKCCELGITKSIRTVRVTVLDMEDLPSVGQEALVDVLSESDGSVTINGNI